MAVTERDIQLKIWGMKENWVNLIQPSNFPVNDFSIEEETDILAITPAIALMDEIIERLKEVDGYVRSMDLIGCEVRLKRDLDSTIRADLLGCSGGRAGISIIEIKKSQQTERQSYTELLGYGNHIQGLFPGMSKEDIFYVLISPMEERIVREASLMSLLFDEKPVFCLIPSWVNNDVNTLTLTPWIPTSAELTNLTEAMFNPSNIEVFKLAWDFIEDWNYEAPDRYPSNDMVERMNKISLYAAQLMEAKNVSGFAFSLQTWEEMPLLPNGLVVAGINPFKVSRDLHLLNLGIPIHELKDHADDTVRLIDLLPELSNAHNTNLQTDYLEALTTGWANTITGIANSVYKTMTRNSSAETFEKGYGGMNWDQYQHSFMEDVTCHNFRVIPTGVIRKLFNAYEKFDYMHLEKFGSDMHPVHMHGDIPEFSIENWNKQYYFRDFLDRLFDPWAELRADTEV